MLLSAPPVTGPHTQRVGTTSTQLPARARAACMCICACVPKLRRARLYWHFRIFIESVSENTSRATPGAPRSKNEARSTKAEQDQEPSSKGRSRLKSLYATRDTGTAHGAGLAATLSPAAAHPHARPAGSRAAARRVARHATPIPAVSVSEKCLRSPSGRILEHMCGPRVATGWPGVSLCALQAHLRTCRATRAPAAAARARAASSVRLSRAPPPPAGASSSGAPCAFASALSSGSTAAPGPIPVA